MIGANKKKSDFATPVSYTHLLPIGGGKGGSDFDPKGKSDREIMAFLSLIHISSVPILLDNVHKHGMISGGDKIVLAGFGAGLTWGACAVEW